MITEVYNLILTLDKNESEGKQKLVTSSCLLFYPLLPATIRDLQPLPILSSMLAKAFDL